MISVCLASYNGQAYIKDQVSSILAELGVEDELIISDDGSTDQTLAILQSLGDPRLSIIHNSTGKGVTANFENALFAARGQFIFLSDQDDIWLPGRVRDTVHLMRSYALVICDAIVVDQNLNPIVNSAFSIRGAKKGFFPNFFRIRYLGCCMAFRRDLLMDILPLPPNHGLVTHDSWIALVGELFYRTYIIKHPYVLYRRHGGNLSGGGGQSSNRFGKKVKIRLYALFSLVKLSLKKLVG